MSGYVVFVMAGRKLAGRLEAVREVVRATGVEAMPGARAPVTGFLMLRRIPLPIVDLRADAEPGDAGDVLVLYAEEDGAMGLAVDRVLSVLAPDDLTPLADNAMRPVGLPAYVQEVRFDVEGEVVLVVDLAALAGLVPA